ncbi:MAG: bile acid:sodium symporter family protein [Rhizobiales bacterium]|nr:bile acid:sodium symporter family protein [Hyphomicrobiales bacterium]
MAPVVLPFALAFLMFAVGLRLDMGQLVGTASRPVPLLTGLMVQMLGLPALAWLISQLLSFSPDLALGLMIIAVCPGGITSSYVSLLAGADVALSTAMTIFTSIAASLTIPVLLDLSGIAIGATSLIQMALVMSMVAAIPLVLGMALRAWAPRLAERLKSRLDVPAKVVFSGVVLATFWQNRFALMAAAATAGPAVILLNGAGILLALSTVLVVGISRRQALTIAVETGLQNAAVAIFICSSILGQPELAVPALLYAVVMNLTALLLLFAGPRFDVARAATD